MHNNHYHVRFHQVYSCIVADLYIWNFSWCLKQYITHCSKCLHYQIARHASYEVLHSIIEFLISFHTVIINFILELLKINTDLDTVMMIICKFFKKIEFIFNKKICHMINEFLIDIMIWTDHFIIIQIMRQMTLISFFTNKLNLHLVRVS